LGPTTLWEPPLNHVFCERSAATVVVIGLMTTTKSGPSAREIGLVNLYDK